MGVAPRIPGGGKKFDTYSFSWWTNGNSALYFFSCVSARGEVSSARMPSAANITLDGGEYVKLKTLQNAYSGKFEIIAKKACKILVFSSLNFTGTTTPTNTYKMKPGDTISFDAEMENTVVIKAGNP